MTDVSYLFVSLRRKTDGSPHLVARVRGMSTGCS